MNGCAVVLAATLVLPTLTLAGPLSVRNGNICFADKSGEPKALTTSGTDAQPVLSPDGRWIVFVRSVPGKTVATGIGDSPATELWQIGVNGKNATLFVRSRSAEKTEQLLANFSKPQFTSDGRKVYFLSDAWVTSGAVHMVDTTNGKEHFVCPGSDLEVIRAGEYKDCLLVEQHRYFIGGGTFDWYWLFRADGREIGPVGEDTENFKATYVPER
jgi:hypothetical protein